MVGDLGAISTEVIMDSFLPDSSWRFWLCLLCLAIWQLAILGYPRGRKLTQRSLWGIALIAGVLGAMAVLLIDLPASPVSWKINVGFAKLAAAIGAFLLLAVAGMLAFREWRETPGSGNTVSPYRYLFWGEVVAPLLIMGGCHRLIAYFPIPDSVETSPSARSIGAMVYGCAGLYLIGGANNVIRGLLSKYQVLPERSVTPPVDESEVIRKMQPPASEVDTKEIERGQAIGNIERLLVMIFIVHGNFEALGFLMAAKGLIRSKEFEDRDRAEYILIGSLASALIAVLVSLLVGWILSRL